MSGSDFHLMTHPLSEVTNDSDIMGSVARMLEDVLENQAGIAKRQSETFRLLNEISAQLQEVSARVHPRNVGSSSKNHTATYKDAENACDHRGLKEDMQGGMTNDKDLRKLRKDSLGISQSSPDEETAAYRILLEDLYLKTQDGVSKVDQSATQFQSKEETLEGGEINWGTHEYRGWEHSN